MRIRYVLEDTPNRPPARGAKHVADALKTGLFPMNFESRDTGELRYGHRVGNSYSARAIDDISLAANRSGLQIARESQLEEPDAAPSLH
jgi:hypothetical protein